MEHLLLFVTQDSDLVIDANGYFAPPGAGGLSMFNLSPCRVLDTRNPTGALPFTGKLDVSITSSSCGVPASAQAYVLNATVVPPGVLGFLTLWPQGTTQPLVSTLNASDGTVTSNMAIVPTINGAISGFTSNASHLVLDISGYFAAAASSLGPAVMRNSGGTGQSLLTNRTSTVVTVGAATQQERATVSVSTCGSVEELSKAIGSAPSLALSTNRMASAAKAIAAGVLNSQRK